MFVADRLRRFLEKDSWAATLWCVVAAFGTYFCMYAFRKPFTSATYEGITFFGLGFKTVSITSQILGYTLSKFIGIKVIAEMPPEKRARSIVAIIAIAEIALFGFGLIPPPFSLFFLFVNGLSLGMVFGLVLGFLEGRRKTEILTAGLCVSFVVADGAAKSLGGYLLSWGVSEYFMPCIAGLVALPPLLFFVGMLNCIPPPSAQDVENRCQRRQMDRADRRRFFRRFAAGLAPIIAVFLLITILRSVRADFAPEIWKGLGLNVSPGMFTATELLVGLCVFPINGACAFLRDNRLAFFSALGIFLLGFLAIAAAALGQFGGWIGGFPFVVLMGIGIYLPYIAVHTTIFERLIAFTRERGNIGYLMYVADAVGYLGYVIVIVYKNFVYGGGDILGFFLLLSGGVVLVACPLTALAGRYYYVRAVEFKTPEPISNSPTQAVFHPHNSPEAISLK